MLMCLLHCLRILCLLHAPGAGKDALLAAAAACSLPHGLQETNQEAAVLAGPYVPPVRMGGGGPASGGSFGKSFGSRGVCLSIPRLSCENTPARYHQHHCFQV